MYPGNLLSLESDSHSEYCRRRSNITLARCSSGLNFNQNRSCNCLYARNGRLWWLSVVGFIFEVASRRGLLYHNCIRFKVPASLRTGWVWWMIPAPPARTNVSPLRSEYKGQICAGKLSLGTPHLLPSPFCLCFLLSLSL